MEGDSAVQAVHGPELARLKASGEPVPEELEKRIAQTRADYDRWLDARHAAARGHVDALIDPLETRRILAFAFDAASAYPHRDSSADGDTMSFRIEQDGRLCRITLAQPEKRNVLDAAACRELLRELTDAAADAATGAILIEADGQIFCAGAEPEDDALFTIGRPISKPIVAAVQGVAISGGLALAANAHVVVAAQGTSFGLTVYSGREVAGGHVSRPGRRTRRTSRTRTRLNRPRVFDTRRARLGTGSLRRPRFRIGRPRH